MTIDGLKKDELKDRTGNGRYEKNYNISHQSGTMKRGGLTCEKLQV